MWARLLLTFGSSWPKCEWDLHSPAEFGRQKSFYVRAWARIRKLDGCNSLELLHSGADLAGYLSTHVTGPDCT